jgi:hypothetical protein
MTRRTARLKEGNPGKRKELLDKFHPGVRGAVVHQRRLVFAGGAKLGDQGRRR